MAQINVVSFRQFAGWPQASSKAYGLVVIRRADPADQKVITIPKTTEFRTAVPGVVFSPSDDYTMSESQSMVEVGLIAVSAGYKGNIPANQHWMTPRLPDMNGQSYTKIEGLLISNPAAFQGGADEAGMAEIADLFYANKLSECNIQMHLDVAVSVAKKIVGFNEDENLPENDRVSQAVYTLTLFFIENRSSQEKVTSQDYEAIKSTKTAYFRSRLEPAIYRRVTSLLNPWIRTWKFVPPYTDPAMEESA